MPTQTHRRIMIPASYKLTTGPAGDGVHLGAEIVSERRLYGFVFEPWRQAKITARPFS